jgi:hypothetical protein
MRFFNTNMKNFLPIDEKDIKHSDKSTLLNDVQRKHIWLDDEEQIIKNQVFHSWYQQL